MPGGRAKERFGRRNPLGVADVAPATPMDDAESGASGDHLVPGLVERENRVGRGADAVGADDLGTDVDMVFAALAP